MVHECSCRCKGEQKGLVLIQIAGSTEGIGITRHRVRSISPVCPNDLRSFRDRQCRRVKGVLVIILNDFHLDNRRCWSCGWLRCSSGTGSRSRTASTTGNQKKRCYCCKRQSSLKKSPATNIAQQGFFHQ